MERIPALSSWGNHVGCSKVAQNGAPSNVHKQFLGQVFTFWINLCLSDNHKPAMAAMLPCMQCEI